MKSILQMENIAFWEKAYDSKREMSWKRHMIRSIGIVCGRLYGVGGKLLKAVQSFYIVSRACVRIGNDLSEWFQVNVGLRQGCVMSPWLRS